MKFNFCLHAIQNVMNLQLYFMVHCNLFIVKPTKIYYYCNLIEGQAVIVQLGQVARQNVSDKFLAHAP